jgi:hypothetical protein
MTLVHSAGFACTLSGMFLFRYIRLHHCAPAAASASVGSGALEVLELSPLVARRRGVSPGASILPSTNTESFETKADERADHITLTRPLL